MVSRHPVAIIVGGGPIGLTTALGLVRANIRFILLERREDVVVEDGSDMTLLPITMHALNQLHLIEPLSTIWNPVSEIARMDHRGRPMGSLNIFRDICKSTGYCPSVVSRHDLLIKLYEALPKYARDQILTGKSVSDIQRTPNGVTVSCKDGSSYNGAFVVGADGVHSVVRTHMRKLALDAGSPKINQQNPFLITYQALWVRFPADKLRGCKPGSATETRGFDVATQLFAGEETATVGVYKRLTTPSQESTRYDEEDEAELIKQCGHLPLLKGGSETDTLCLRDVYEARLSSGLVDLEEGVIPHWSWGGRIVLVGDAAHKFTPSTGSGLNYGMLDSVVLVNQLHALSKNTGSGEKCCWTTSSLSQAFQAYQQERHDDVEAGCEQASGATAMATWSTTVFRLLDMYILPRSIVQWLLGKRIASKAKNTRYVKFEF